MFHATLIVGGDAVKRLEKASAITGIKLTPAIDVLIIEPEPSIKIAQIRAIQKFLARKPLKLKAKICLLIEAQTLTLAAQNAFLKTLEEPPAHSQIILLASATAKLLPTVVSRCQLINLGSFDQLSTDEQKQQDQIFKQILSSSAGARISLASSLAAQAKNFCVNQLKFLHQPLKRENLGRIKRLEQSLKYLEANVNTKLVLEQLLLNW